MNKLLLIPAACLALTLGACHGSSDGASDSNGINRHFGNGNMKVWINGHLCPTVGNICMDACMVDVTDAKCHVGDSVEIFGQHVSVMQLAETLDTIPYEILTSVSTRVKRVYYRE